MALGFIAIFCINLAISLAMSFVLGMLRDVPKGPSAAGLDAFDFPTAEVGREFPVLFGHKDLPSQNIVWYGDLGARGIKKKVKTGLFSKKKVTVGYEYRLGMHMVLMHDLDEITKITSDGKTAWSGSATGSITVNSPNLFGGKESGGGLAGKIDILKGGATQSRHPYLQSQLGNDIPAFRGVVTLVFYGAGSSFYWGNSTHIYPLVIRCKNIYDDWYPAKAAIGTDMNPAHIIRETIINKRWGLAYDASDVDDVNFSAVADTLYNEGFGLSMLWDQSSKIEDFISEVLKHIDAMLYTDTQTGQFTLKLIRDDYNPATIPVFNESNIVSVEQYRRQTLEDIANSITVQFWDREAGKQGSITRADIAMVARMGGTNNTTITFPGIADKQLAEWVLSRELRCLSTPLSSGAILTTREGFDLAPGDPFIFSWPRYGVEEVVMRVSAIEYGEFGKSEIRIEFVEDVFGVESATFTAPPPSGWISPIHDPAPCPVHVSIETPYFEIAREKGVTETANLGDSAGYASIAGTKPSNDATSADVYFRLSGGTYVKEETTDFASYALLGSDISLIDTVLSISWQKLEDIELGDWAVIDDEIVRIDAFDETSITVGRGCLDTVPTSHLANAYIVLVENTLATGGVKYYNGNVVNAKMCPSTGKGTLALADAPEQTITMNSRLIRPYPPAHLRLAGLADPDEIFGDISTAWRHRDRTLQLEESINDTEDDIDIGPEAGTTYEIEVRKNSDNTLLHSESGISGKTATLTSVEIGWEGLIDVTLWSVRDGFPSWQKQLRTFLYFRTEPRSTEDGEARITESGEYRILEV